MPPAKITLLSVETALRRLTLGNAQVTYLDYLLTQERLAPETAATRWLGEYAAVVQHWLG